MKWRPQILVAMILLAFVAGMAIWVGWRLEATEIITGAAGGGLTGISILGMKVLEGE